MQALLILLSVVGMLILKFWSGSDSSPSEPQGKVSQTEQTVIVHNPIQSPPPAPSIAQVTLKCEAQRNQDGGMFCRQNTPEVRAPQNGAEFVSELSVNEFVQQALKNSDLIDSYLVRIEGGSEIEHNANYQNMKSVVVFAEYLESNAINLASFVSNNGALHRAIGHANKAGEYRERLSKM
jgi:hypothetical protein